MANTVITSSQAPAPIGPYSQAIVANGVLYASGQIALDPVTGNLIQDDIETETHRVMKNLQAVLQEAGLDFTHVVKCTIFVKDLENFSRINGVYGQYFTQHAPARETVEVSRLPKDVNVEISCIAVQG